MKIIPYQELEFDEDNILEQVEYRGEGNSSIVIALKQRAQVIKLSKRHVKSCDSKHLSELLKSSLENVIYIENIFKPLAEPYLSANFKLIYLKPDFITRLNDAVEPHRPLQRLEKSLICQDQYAMLMNDLCLLPKFITQQLISNEGHREDFFCGPTFSVEVKPKQGFLPIQPTTSINQSCREKATCFVENYKNCSSFIINGGNNNDDIQYKHHGQLDEWHPGNSCLYGSNQYLKLLRGQVRRISGYCPLDLFSGCPKRMKNAIRQLIFNPQNNFRIFKDLTLVYDEENKSHKSFANAIDGLFASIKAPATTLPLAMGKQIPIASETSRNDRRDSGQDENRFINILCRMLLNRNEADEQADASIQFVDNHECLNVNEFGREGLKKPNASSQVCFDHISLDKCKRCDPIITRNKFNKNEVQQNECDPLIINNNHETIPDRHRLPEGSVLYHVLKAQQIDTIGIHNATSMLEWLLQNNEPGEVYSMLSSPQQPPGFGSPHQLTYESRFNFYIRKVYEFLVSMTAKDCSMMITFQRISSKCQKHIEQNMPELKNNLLTEKSSGLYFLYSIGLTDLDKKKPNKLPVIRDNVDISHKIRLENQAISDQNLEITVMPSTIIDIKKCKVVT